MDKLKSLSFLFVLAIPSLLHAAGCESYPQGLAFMGYSGERWDIYTLTDRGAVEAQETKVEPRGFAYRSMDQSALYVGIDDTLYFKTGSNERVIAKPSNKSSYTQPAFSPDGKSFYLVEMKNGNSKDTDIAQVDIETGEFKRVSKQRSAQFEPFPSGTTLYYSNVSCVESCGQIIQEIWSRDVVSGASRQLTLLNNISKQPVSSANSDRLYFSSNSGGNYSIWEYSHERGSETRLTSGDGIDLYPAVAGVGQVYFIRRKAGRTKLMCKTQGGPSVELPLPESISNVRELKVSQW